MIQQSSFINRLDISAQFKDFFPRKQPFCTSQTEFWGNLPNSGVRIPDAKASDLDLTPSQSERTQSDQDGKRGEARGMWEWASDSDLRISTDDHGI